MDAASVKNLTFTWPDGEQPLFSEVSFALAAGSFTLLLGPTGSGKSTLLRHLCPALFPPGERHGELHLGGTVGYVAQNPAAQAVTDTVLHELAFGLENQSLPPDKIGARVMETACALGLTHLLERSTADLSGGELQLVNAAAALALDPALLVLDEPLSQLDPVAAREFLSLLTKAREELGTTILLTAHELTDLLPLADRVLYLAGGRLTSYDSPREFVRRCPEEYLPSLPAAPALWKRLGGHTLPLTVAQGRGWVAERQPGHRSFSPQTPEGDPLLTARDVWFRYDGRGNYILRGLDLTLQAGTLTALVGGNGSGKSTALKVLAGVERPHRGKAKGSRTALLPQDPRALFVSDRVEQDLLMTGNKDTVYRLAEELGALPLLSRYAGDLSGGELQKCALIMALATEAPVLLLDEPTKGMDAAARDQALELLKGYAAQGRAILLCTHELELAARTDVCTMMGLGRIISGAPSREFFLENRQYTTPVRRMTRGLIEGCVLPEDLI